jgi:hypothetical protein
MMKNLCKSLDIINHFEKTGSSMVSLHEYEKQLILYTKGHFKEINYNRDLKYFAAKLYDLYPSQVEQYSIIHMVTHIYQKLVTSGYIRFILPLFLDDIFKRAWRENGNHNASWDTVLNQMLAEIQNTRVQGLNLGEADISILTEVEEGVCN